MILFLSQESRTATKNNPGTVDDAGDGWLIIVRPTSNMSRPLRIPKPQTPLHLYRHLLRESSYLPPLARPFVDNQIKDRFSRNRDGNEDKASKCLRQAHHDLRLLRAANAGDTSRMRRILLLAFGRVGRRRRELMAELVSRDIPTTTDELEIYAAEASAIASQGRTMDWLDTWDVEKLQTFARSQIQAGLASPPKAGITPAQTTPAKAIPTENIWGRPLPAKLARTKLRKMWKSVADKCMPPLPKEEWKSLGDISEGAVGAEWSPAPRRQLAQSISGDAFGTRSWDWQSYAVKPVVAVDRPANRRNKLLTGAVDDNTPTGDPQPAHCHKYTARSWQRLMGTIWQLSPTMEKKAGGWGWDIAWGRLDFQTAPASAGAMEFFNDFPITREVKTPGKGRT
jgi:hypothetical protein